MITLVRRRPPGGEESKVLSLFAGKVYSTTVEAFDADQSRALLHAQVDETVTAEEFMDLWRRAEQLPPDDTSDDDSTGWRRARKPGEGRS